MYRKETVLNKLRVVYFIQSHTNLNQVSRLISTIRQYAPRSIIVIGHDVRAEKFDHGIVAGMPDVHVLENYFSQFRGDFSLLKPYLKAINWLQEQGIRYDWITYLSGQHYPTQSPATFETFLSETEYDGFLSHWSMSSPAGQAEVGRMVKRYHYQYYRMPAKLTLFYRFLFKLADKLDSDKVQTFPTYGNLIGFKASEIPFTDKFECYRGHQWTTLSAKSVNYLLEFMDENPDVVRFFEKTVVPDEAFVQTILANNPALSLCNNNLLYHDFQDDFSGRPRVMTMNDIDILRNKDYFFARKFDTHTDSQILDALDSDFIKQSV